MKTNDWYVIAFVFAASLAIVMVFLFESKPIAQYILIILFGFSSIMAVFYKFVFSDKEESQQSGTKGMQS